VAVLQVALSARFARSRDELTRLELNEDVWINEQLSDNLNLALFSLSLVVIFFYTAQEAINAER